MDFQANQHTILEKEKKQYQAFSQLFVEMVSRLRYEHIYQSATYGRPRKHRITFITTMIFSNYEPRVKHTLSFTVYHKRTSVRVKTVPKKCSTTALDYLKHVGNNKTFIKRSFLILKIDFVLRVSGSYPSSVYACLYEF